MLTTQKPVSPLPGVSRRAALLALAAILAAGCQETDDRGGIGLSSRPLVVGNLSGVFGGGPIYKKRATTINELKASGFNEVVVWNIFVFASGDLNFNAEFPLVSNGVYVGGTSYPLFASDMALLKTAPTTVNRLTFSVGSSAVGVFQAIRDLVNTQGTGPTSILYRNFLALKTAIPGIDAIDFDDENAYHTSSMVAFAVMLADLGYKVTLDPYTNAAFWTNVATQVNAQRPGAIDGVHLQAYAGGQGNTPCSGWGFGAIPVFPGLWDINRTPAQAQNQLATWKAQCGITGGWMWLYDDFYGTTKTAQYAAAINNAMAGAGPTGVIFFASASYAGTATKPVPKGNFTLSQLRTSYGFVDNWASSALLPSGWTTTMYANDRWGGASRTLAASQPDFTQITFNDVATSCRIP